MTTNVPETETWATRIAAELHRIADDFASTITADLPAPRMVALHIQPGGKTREADDEVIGTVDALGRAILDTPGAVQPMSDGTYHYGVEGNRGPIGFKAYREISTARIEQMAAAKILADKEAELAALRAEVEKLRAEAAPVIYPGGVTNDPALDDEDEVQADPTGLDEVPDGQLVETVHWSPNMFAPTYACGAETGLFAHRIRENVTCPACLAAMSASAD